MMRSLWIRCLVVLLSLALVSGNTHAALHTGLTHNEPCSEVSADSGVKPLERHSPNKAAGQACCCDCLGCGSVGLSPDLTFASAELSGVGRYSGGDDHLIGRALLPELDPPRPITLS